MSVSRVKSGLQELRCFCSRSPLLAVYGIDKDRRPFVHVKIYKQGRVYGETFHRGGTVEIRCRECIRWHRIHIEDTKASLVPVEEPTELQNEIVDDAGSNVTFAI